MHYQEIRDVTFEIIRAANGYFLLPYQIFKKIERRDRALAERLRDEYPVANGNPQMGAGAGINYSIASFIAQTLEYFRNDYPQIKKEWIEPSDINIEGIEPGNRVAISIWAWKEE